MGLTGSRQRRNYSKDPIGLTLPTPAHKILLMRRLIYFYFFFSGFCGLIYEILWTRLFVLVMGGTVYSFTTVLVAFMSGLALGGFLGGKYADRMKRSPLLVYGILEGLIGVYCLLIPYLIQGLNPIFNWLYPFLFAHHISGLMVRFFFSGLILIIPTTLMGATLPILVRYQYRDRAGFGKTTGILYGINTFGAVAGSFVSGMILIPRLGQGHTLYISAGLNLLIFFSILVLGRIRGAEFGSRREGLEKSDLPGRLNWKAGLVLSGYALSGMAAMIYQVAWTRALILSLGTTLYVLSLILTAYIAGLALGALVITLLVDRIKRLWLWIGVFELGIGISAWLVVPLFARLPIWMILAHHPRSYSHWLAIEFLIGLGLIFLPTFLMGMLLPLVVRLYAQLRGGVVVAVGEVYAWNTMGAILGSFICGFFLISWLGVRNSLSLASILSLLIGWGFLLGEKKLRLVQINAGIGVALLVFGFVYFQPGWEPEIINSAPYNYYREYQSKAQGGKSLAQLLKRQSRLLYYRDGAEATVSVFEYPGPSLVLRINGKIDASTGMGMDMTTQILSGQIPLLLHPNPKRVAVIGLASGVTLGSVLTHPIDEAVCLEISPEVVEASKYFSSWNRRPLEDKRTRLVINDGRYHLAHTRESYDVIISEPSNPWISGEGLLFTEEFFQQAKDRLAEDGIMLVWSGIYDMDLYSMQMIVRTFLEVFPEASLWEVDLDYLLVGFKGDLEIDYSVLKSRLQDPKIKSDLARINLDQPEKLMARMLMGPEELKEFAKDAPVHTDDRRQLEIYVPELLYDQEIKERLLGTLQAFRELRQGGNKYLKFSDPADEKDLENINRFYLGRWWLLNSYLAEIRGGSQGIALESLIKAWEIDPSDLWVQDKLYVIYSRQAQAYLAQGKVEEAMNYLSQSWMYKPEDNLIPDLVSRHFIGKKDLPSARKWMEKALAKNNSDPLAWMMRGEIELKEGKAKDALQSLKQALANWAFLSEMIKLSGSVIVPKNPENYRAELYLNLGRANRQLGNLEQAQADLEQAFQIQPNSSEVLLASGELYLEQGQIDSALKRISKALELDSRNPESHLLFSQALEKVPERRAQAIQELKTFLELAPPDWPDRAKMEKHLSDLISGQ